VLDPQFQGQTKDRLNNPDAQKIVRDALSRELEDYVNKNADAIVQRVLQALRARYASRDAMTEVRRKSVVSKVRLPGKLADCSSTNSEGCELFLVEGDSAGGSAKQGRDRNTQAILPLRGKVLNTEGVSLQKLMSNEELSNIVEALGCGIGPTFDEENLRYGSVIIMTDADQDGAHISTLLLAFFYRHMPQLIESGRVYLAQPPLFSVSTKEGSEYALDNKELQQIEKRLSKKGKRYEVTRFKGLGEMPAKELYSTTMDASRRRLLRVEIPINREVETEAVMADLFGKDASRRLDYIY
jgi:DNA gyrase subunit B/topoisomerase-4 subunit B